MFKKFIFVFEYCYCYSFVLLFCHRINMLLIIFEIVVMEKNSSEIKFLKARPGSRLYNVFAEK